MLSRCVLRRARTPPADNCLLSGTAAAGTLAATTRALRIWTSKRRVRGSAAGSRVVIYTAESCWYCDAAKTLLDERNVPYEEVLLPRTALGRARLVAITSRMTFPQIVIDGRRVGGYQALAVADRAGTLTDLAALETRVESNRA